MINIDLDRSIEDTEEPSLPIAASFVGLTEYFSILEEFVPQIQQQLLIRALARINSTPRNLDPAEAEEELFGVRWLVGDVVPNNTYAPMIFTVWAVLEESLNRILEYLLKRNVIATRIRKAGNRSEFEHLKFELERGLGSPLQVQADTLISLEQLQVVRNVLAHANGSVLGLRADRRTKLDQVVRAGVGITVKDGAVQVSRQFIQSALEAAEVFCNALLRQLSLRVPLKSAP